MNMTERLMEVTAEVREQASAYAERTVEAARHSMDQAADRVASAAGPVENLAAAASRFNKVAYNYANEMLSHQANVLTGALQDGAERLRLLNKATSMKDAYRAQVKYFDVTRDRVVRDARTAWKLVSHTGTELRTLALEAYGDLARKPAAKRTNAHVRRAAHRASPRTKKAA